MKPTERSGSFFHQGGNQMRFVLEVECDNDAFATDLAGTLGAIIRTCAGEVEAGVFHGKLRDPNGNKVAEYHLTHALEEDAA